MILKDVAMLGITYDKFSYTSDHFDLLQDLCEKMIKLGKAYVDDTDPETMKKEREERKDSVNRNNSKSYQQRHVQLITWLYNNVPVLYLTHM